MSYISESGTLLTSAELAAIVELTNGPGVSTTTEIVYVIDGGGIAITTGQKGYMEIPFNLQVTGWTLAADQPGSVVIDVWRAPYASFPPVVGNSITGNDKPTLISAQNSHNQNVTLWTNPLNAGDIIGYNVSSTDTITRVMLSIKATRL